jgi:general secretion pathway protein F
MQFTLTVYRKPDGVISLSVDAADEQAALRQAAEQGYQVLSAASGASRHRRGAGTFPLVLFSQQLLALLRAGLNLVAAFETLAEKEQSEGTKAVLDGVLSGLYAGKPLSLALEGLPQAFPPLYVATVRASERTGDIVQSLERYVAHQVQLDQVKKKIVNAMIYPVLLMLVGSLVALFLLGYVVPKFSHIFEERGTELPLPTQILVTWGRLLNENTWQVAIALLAFVGAVAFAASRRGARAWCLRALWSVPGIGARMRLFQLARMYRTLGMLLQGGMPIIASLALVKDLLDASLRDQLARATRRINEGGTVSQAMFEHGLSTSVAIRMLRVGEQTGDLGSMMERIAAFYDDELSRAADVFTRVFEPALMALIGILTGAIVLFLYLPIFELASSVS